MLRSLYCQPMHPMVLRGPNTIESRWFCSPHLLLSLLGPFFITTCTNKDPSTRSRPGSYWWKSTLTYTMLYLVYRTNKKPQISISQPHKPYAKPQQAPQPVPGESSTTRLQQVPYIRLSSKCHTDLLSITIASSILRWVSHMALQCCCRPAHPECYFRGLVFNSSTSQGMSAIFFSTCTLH